MKVAVNSAAAHNLRMHTATHGHYCCSVFRLLRRSRAPSCSLPPTPPNTASCSRAQTPVTGEEVAHSAYSEQGNKTTCTPAHRHRLLLKLDALRLGCVIQLLLAHVVQLDVLRVCRRGGCTEQPPHPFSFSCCRCPSICSPSGRATCEGCQLLELREAQERIACKRRVHTHTPAGAAAVPSGEPLASGGSWGR